jgi:hypothetical protein
MLADMEDLRFLEPTHFGLPKGVLMGVLEFLSGDECFDFKRVSIFIKEF